MVRIFVRFLIETLGVRPDDIRLTMRLYNHINELEAQRYWKGVSGLKKENFKKSTFLITGASKGKRPFNRLPHGTLQIAVYSTERFHWLMGLIEGVKRKIDYDTVHTRLGSSVGRALR